MLKTHKANLRQAMLSNDPALDLAAVSPGFRAAMTLLQNHEEGDQETGGQKPHNRPIHALNP